MKQTNKLYLILGCIAILCGFYMLIAYRVKLFHDLGLSETIALLLAILGGGIFLLGCGLLAYSLLLKAKQNKEYIIGENDERNIAIRGKATQIVTLVNTGMNIIMLVIFIILDMSTASILLSGAMAIQIFALLYSMIYYDKRM